MGVEEGGGGSCSSHSEAITLPLPSRWPRRSRISSPAPRAQRSARCTVERLCAENRPSSAIEANPSPRPQSANWMASAVSTSRWMAGGRSGWRYRQFSHSAGLNPAIHARLAAARARARAAADRRAILR